MHSSNTLYSRDSDPYDHGIVYKKVIGNYFVRRNQDLDPNLDGNDPFVTCSISTKLRRELIYPIADPASLRRRVVGVRNIDVVDPVAVGDQVRFVDAQDGTGLIVEVLPRKSQLVRRAAVSESGKHAKEQVIVANLDQVVPVFAAAQPTPKWNLLDRYLVSAESLGLSSLICITKMDLLRDEAELQEELEIYRKIGYPVIVTSAVTGRGLEAITAALQERFSVLVGKSGVGKSSLLNALEPELGLRVNLVNQVTGKGKHTTTNLEMFPLSFGGSLVDTPGMREFGLWEVDESNLAYFFPEMRPYVGTCRFGLDCSHDHEPGCAIREAVASGEISQRRYQSFLRLRESQT